MKISINIQPTLYCNKSGIGFYATEMISALIARNKNNEYSLDYFDFNNKRRSSVEKFISDNSRLNCCSWFLHSWYQMLWAVLPIPYTIFFKATPEVSIFFNYYLPSFVKGKKIIVVYDTVIKDHPETMSFKTRFMLGLKLKRSIKRADRIVTISEFSKKQIIKHYGVNENKITVIPCAADRKKYYPMQDCKEKIEAIKNKYGIDGEYYFYLGNLEPRKNIVRLIEAYYKAQKQKNNLPRLVLAGGKGWLYDDIFSKVKELNLEGSIIFTGYVEDEDVPFLMNGARVFCFPSLYEGFGMPPLEAMSCGTTVIVSNCTSLPEVVGECGISVDPYSVDDIAKALITADDDAFIADQREKCIKRSEAFSWDTSSAIFENVIKELVNE